MQYLNDPFEFLPFISRVMDQDDQKAMYTAFLEPLVSQVWNSPIEVERIPTELQSVLPKSVIDWITSLRIGEAFALAPDFHPKNILSIIQQKTDGAPGLNKTVREGWQEKFGVLSFSMREDNITMWSHYSMNHSGFLIEFDLTDSFFDRRRNPADFIRHVRKVNYREDRPNIKLVTPIFEMVV